MKKKIALVVSYSQKNHAIIKEKNNKQTNQEG
jgi:hypothetical protein